MKKVVLAYSGGLDTSVILKWLSNKGYEVIAACIDVGQKEDFDAVAKKAIAVGASKVYIIDSKDEFVEDYVIKGLQAGAVYENDYLLGTAYARPLISEKLVSIAKLENAEAIAHGATGKGNDQVRFESGIMALAPEIKVIAPWREWSLKSREDCIDYAKEHNIPLTVTKEKIYSRDENLYHISHEGGNLENPWSPHNEDVYMWVKPLSKTPDIPEIVDITFEKGVPVAINGEKMSPKDILVNLNEKGSIHHIGVIDIIENRLVGMKSRGVYETPGGTILHKAHQGLEKLVHDRSTMKMKNQLAMTYADMLYDGQWFSPLKKSIDAFVLNTQEVVTGIVKVTLFKGQVSVAASKSEFALYEPEYVTFGEDDVYNQKDAEGFIKLFALPLKLNYLNQKELYKYDTKETNVKIYEGDDYESMAGTI